MDPFERIRELEARVAQMSKQLRELQNENQELRNQLKQFIALAEERLPRYAKEEAKTKREKPSGRPEGHEGVGRKTPEEIQRYEKLEAVTVCPDCGKPVAFKRSRRRVISQLIPGKVENVEYEIPQAYCNHCQKPVEPKVPNALPNCRFDLTLALWIACLRMLGVSVDKIRFLLETDYSLKISSATVVNTTHKLAELLGEEYEQLRQQLLKERQAHGDETSWRVKGKNHWLWEFISKRIAYFTIRPSRGRDVPEEVMKGFKGVFTSDFWSAYNALKGEKQKCWVHLQRELEKVLKFEPSKEFALFSKRLLRLYSWAKSERNHGSKTREFAEKRLHVLLSKNYLDENCGRLVKRLKRSQFELFTFCAHRGLEPHNNLAERGIRPAVVIRKTTFGSQSQKGAGDTAVLMSFFQTAKLQGENFNAFVQNLIDNRLQY